MAFADPAKNINFLELREGEHVADFGAGTGFYAIAAARKVGDSGRVYALDVQKDLLDKLRDKLKQDRISNIETIWADLDSVGGSNLAELSMDACIISNILFQSEDKNALVTEADRILKSKGRVMVIDWSDSYGGLGPTPSDIVTKEQVKNLFTPKGFIIESEFDAGDHHYGIIFRKNK